MAQRRDHQSRDGLHTVGLLPDGAHHLAHAEALHLGRLGSPRELCALGCYVDPGSISRVRNPLPGETMPRALRGAGLVVNAIREARRGIKKSDKGMCKRSDAGTRKGFALALRLCRGAPLRQSLRSKASGSARGPLSLKPLFCSRREPQEETRTPWFAARVCLPGPFNATTYGVLFILIYVVVFFP